MVRKSAAAGGPNPHLSFLLVIVKYVELLHTQLTYLLLLVALLIIYVVLDSVGLSNESVLFGLTYSNILVVLIAALLAALLYHSYTQRMVEEEVNKLFGKVLGK